MKFLEQVALKWFCKEICDHVTCGAMLNSGIATLDVVSDETVSNFNVSYLLSTGLSSILCQQHCALIVLKNNIVSHGESLCLQEQSDP